MWSLAVYDFGLSNEEFLRLTPAQFYALSKRFDVSRKHGDFGFGLVTSAIYNCHRKKGKKAFEPSDFMPTYEVKVKQKTSSELHDYWRKAVLGSFPVIDLRDKEQKENGG